MKEKYINNELTEKIIKAFYDVYNELGFGFLENVYQNALYYELKNNQLKVEAQKPITVYYQNQIVGNYKVDLIVKAKTGKENIIKFIIKRKTKKLTD